MQFSWTRSPFTSPKITPTCPQSASLPEVRRRGGSSFVSWAKPKTTSHGARAPLPVVAACRPSCRLRQLRRVPCLRPHGIAALPGAPHRYLLLLHSSSSYSYYSINGGGGGGIELLVVAAGVVQDACLLLRNRDVGGDTWILKYNTDLGALLVHISLNYYGIIDGPWTLQDDGSRRRKDNNKAAQQDSQWDSDDDNVEARVKSTPTGVFLYLDFTPLKRWSSCTYHANKGLRRAI